MFIDKVKLLFLARISLLLLFLCGCQGAANQLSEFTLGGGGTDNAVSSGFLPLSVVDGGTAIATIHNPEPTTVFLLGSGLITMGLYRNRKKNK